MTKKKTKLAFDFKAEGLDEAEVDKILTIRRCDVVVIKLPSLECEVEEAGEKIKRDILNTFFSARNDHYAGDAIGTVEDGDGKLRPFIWFVPSKQDIATMGKMEVVTGKYRPNLLQEPPEQNIGSNKKENSIQHKKSRKKGGQYDYPIRRLSALINDPSITSEFRNQCEEQKERLQNLQKEERLEGDPEALLKDALKINQVIDQQIYDLCEEVLKERSGITEIKSFHLVAEILTVKGRIGFDWRKVKTAYWNVFNRREVKKSKDAKK